MREEVMKKNKGMKEVTKWMVLERKGGEGERQ